ncbi:MAG: adenylosuccinate lyase [Oscillospiraceae bacterium]|jgi:adenylosuccinate lyase|nr:adenylosuccinate lyase [Oscillospiraceae bacterium]
MSLVHNSYQSPLASRYASSEMLFLFSDQKKFSTWRRLWLILAESERELGYPITDAQLDAMRAHLDDIDFDSAGEWERKLRHDVMAHIHTFGEAAPGAEAIIHLGATSCYVGDNTDILIMREGLEYLARKLAGVIEKLAGFALEYKALPTLGFTHFQPAQLTTVGKRATLWLYDFLTDLKELEYRRATLLPRGAKGTTGTQASFLELFDGDYEKVERLDTLVAQKLGFEKSVPVTGQTYSRKADYYVISALSGLAQSAGKFATDLRLLSHLKELEEPFESKQVGSSAMPYKRNPMRCERICSLARYIITDTLNPALTSYNQWLERTLDDSANRRIAIPEAFLAADSILNILSSVVSGIKVYPKVIEKHIMDELPFMATENIMMDAVSKGGNRQELHERIRVHSVAAGARVKEEGLPNDLIERIASDPGFGLNEDEIRSKLNPESYIGAAPRQVERFIKNDVRPALAAYRDKAVEGTELVV